MRLKLYANSIVLISEKSDMHIMVLLMVITVTLRISFASPIEFAFSLG